jgi:hypothetical protein
MKSVEFLFHNYLVRYTVYQMKNTCAMLNLSKMMNLKCYERYIPLFLFFYYNYFKNFNDINIKYNNNIFHIYYYKGYLYIYFRHLLYYYYHYEIEFVIFTLSDYC